MSTVFTRRPAMNTSRRLPAGAPIWPDRIPASARLRPPLNNTAEAPATPLRKFLRLGMSSPSLSKTALGGSAAREVPAHESKHDYEPRLDYAARVITHNSRSRHAGRGHPPLLDLYEHRVFGIDKLNDRRAGNL